MKRLSAILAVLLLALTLCGCAGFADLPLPLPEESAPQSAAASLPETQNAPDPDGSYTDRDGVALYLYSYGRLPSNFITKSDAKKLGWVASEGNLNEVAPGKSIGGDRFGNYEGLLPDADGRVWRECDIDYAGGSRGAKRIVFSDDGLIYYTDDHYASFTRLY